MPVNILKVRHHKKRVYVFIHASFFKDFKVGNHKNDSYFIDFEDCNQPIYILSCQTEACFFLQDCGCNFSSRCLAQTDVNLYSYLYHENIQKNAENLIKNYMCKQFRLFPIQFINLLNLICSAVISSTVYIFKHEVTE